MTPSRALALALSLALLGCGSGGTGDASTPPTDGSATPMDVPAGPNACLQAGGMCVPANRGAMGFTFRCPEGFSLRNGRTDFYGPGTDLLPGGSANGGCSQGSTGFEAALFGCCYPAPADAGSEAGAEAGAESGVDASADAPSDATSSSEGGAADPCTASGGTVAMQSCCGSVGDFPNECSVGACGCGPSGSHPVRVCRCPGSQCFDGTRCTSP